MKVEFFTKESFSIFATLNSIIPLFLLILFKQEINLNSLVLSSIITMMSGKLSSKLIFTIFLFLLIINEKNYQSVAIYLISVIIIDNIPYNNKIQNSIINNKYKLYLFRLIILIWFIYILYLLIIKMLR